MLRTDITAYCLLAAYCVLRTKKPPASRLPPPAASFFLLRMLRDVVRLVTRRLPVAAAALTAYDPAYDAGDRMLAVGLELMTALPAPGRLGSTQYGVRRE